MKVKRFWIDMAKGDGRFALCVATATYKASSEPRKVYRVLRIQPLRRSPYSAW